MARLEREAVVLYGTDRLRDRHPDLLRALSAFQWNGVIDRAGTGLERFVTYGMTDEVERQIGDPPHGRGILGVLISDARNLRLHDLSEHPRSVGFPPGHPPMNTFLGVPIMLRSVAYGNLYLTEKDGGGDFTDEDEELVSLLAAQAAVAVENARLYESATSWSHQLESLNEIGGALVGELELEPLLDLIATRLRELIGARLVAIALPAGEGLRIAAADGEGASDLAAVSHLERDSKTGRVLERGRSERIDSLLEDPEVNQDIARRLGASTGLYVPLARTGTTHRRARRARQAAARSPVHERRPATRRAVREPSRRSRSISRGRSRATHCAASLRDKSWSGAGSRGSCTTRQAKR